MEWSTVEIAVIGGSALCLLGLTAWLAIGWWGVVRKEQEEKPLEQRWTRKDYEELEKLRNLNGKKQ